MQFKLQDLAIMATDIHYYPGLANAVNAALHSRNKIEYKEALETATKIALGYSNVEVQSKKDYGTSSGYIPGMPLWQPVQLEDKETKKKLLLESAIVELSRQKNIISTVIQGRDTSVDEFINNGDWQISISGVLCQNQASYPLDLVNDFNEFMELNRSLTITHEVLTELDILEVVVLSYQLAQTPYINWQRYSITAKSTKPVVLRIQETNQLSV